MEVVSCAYLLQLHGLHHFYKLDFQYTTAVESITQRSTMIIILYKTYIPTTIRGISINHFLINNYVKPFCRHHNRNEDFCSLSLLPCITRCKKLL